MAAERLIAAYKGMAVWAFSDWFYLIVLVTEIRIMIY